MGGRDDVAAWLIVPGAPWADGTVGGVLAVNGDHGRMHWSWLREGLSASTQE